MAAGNWMKMRRSTQILDALCRNLDIIVILVLAVLVGINFLANRYDKSYDSTANKQFSLADQTIKDGSGT